MDALWSRLSEGGQVMMELGAYPFSERYGWTQDRYGLSWQVMYAGGEPIRQHFAAMDSTITHGFAFNEAISRPRGAEVRRCCRQGGHAILPS